jgi:phytoene synthase
VRPIAALAERRLAAARAGRAAVPKAALPALLPARAVGAYLHRIRRAGFDPYDARVGQPDPWAAARLWWGWVVGGF